MLERNCAS